VEIDGLSLSEWLAKRRAEHAADVAATQLNSDGWKLSQRGALVVTCPACGQKTGAYLDMSMGPKDEIGHECECGAVLRLNLDWCIEPELVEVAISPGA